LQHLKNDSLQNFSQKDDFRTNINMEKLMNSEKAGYNMFENKDD